MTLWASAARAGDITHIVAKGQTLGSIAQHYGATVRSIELANRLKSGQQIYPGQKLRILDVDESRVAAPAAPPGRPVDRSDLLADAEPDDDDPPCVPLHAPTAGPNAPGGQSENHRAAGGRDSVKADPYARKPARPGFLTLVRYGEVFRGQLLDAESKVLAQSQSRISRLMRDLRANRQIPIDPALLKLLAEVSDHFGGRTITVVSGYREYTRRQFTRSSRHNFGRAVDFRIVGVPNEVLRDYCLTLPGAGVGYYPNSTFVHLDHRGYRSAWTDYSEPGRAPRYTCRPTSATARRAPETLPPTKKAPRRPPATVARVAGSGTPVR